MDRDIDALLNFAPDYDAPIPYMQRTREYYAAIGYTTPYRWAHYVEAPFTAAAQADGRVRRLRSSPPPRRISQTRAIRGRARRIMAARSSTRCIRATRRSDTTCASPISATTASTPRRQTATPGFRCRRCCARRRAGRIGAVASRFHGAPTNRSHRVTMETDAPEILRRCREDDVDAAIVVPNCPVCHQTSSLVARHLEANGIPTVLMGCAKDIVEHAAVPRFLFSDFPLGNSAGKPHDVASQDQTLELALRVLESASRSADDDAVAAAME